MNRPEQVLQLLDKQSFICAKDLTKRGIPRIYLHLLHRRGLIERAARGLYVRVGASFNTEHYTLTAVCKRIPAAVVCLLSALRFHNLTTQNPVDIWIAMPRNVWVPRLEYPPLQVVRFSGSALREGVENHETAPGMHVRVYSVAKTVADCFKHRHKIGLDVALEALREGWKQKRFPMDQLWHYAAICRVANVMRPYLEAIV